MPKKTKNPAKTFRRVRGFAQVAIVAAAVGAAIWKATETARLKKKLTDTWRAKAETGADTAPTPAEVLAPVLAPPSPSGDDSPGATPLETAPTLRAGADWENDTGAV